MIAHVIVSIWFVLPEIKRSVCQRHSMDYQMLRISKENCITFVQSSGMLLWYRDIFRIQVQFVCVTSMVKHDALKLKTLDTTKAVTIFKSSQFYIKKIIQSDDELINGGNLEIALKIFYSKHNLPGNR